jgi:hypothetical protein
VSRVAPQDAFDLSEAFRLTLRGAGRKKRTVEVRPLTFRRFLGVLGANLTELVGRLAIGVTLPPKSEEPKTVGDLAKIIGQSLAHLDHAPFAELVHVVAPEVSVAAWEEGGSSVELMCMVAWFHRIHDWEYIGESTSFGKPIEASDGKSAAATLSGALVGLAKATGERVGDLLDTRVEGFFVLKEGAEELLTRDSEPDAEMSGDPAVLGLCTEKDPNAPFWTILAESRKKLEH